MPGFGVGVRHIDDVRYVRDNGMRLFAIFSLEEHCPDQQARFEMWRRRA
jgi:hypothetical protein